MANDTSCILDPQRDCIGLNEAKRLEAELNDLRRQNSSTHERIFDRLGELEKFEEVNKVQYNHIIEKLDRVTKSIDSIEAKPAKKWDNFIEKLMFTVMGVVVTYLLIQIGIK